MVDEEMVENLRELLARAEAGTLRGVVWVAFDQARQWEYQASGEAITDMESIPTVLGCLRLVGDEIADTFHSALVEVQARERGH